jgi:predicted dehydrogenase
MGPLRVGIIGTGLAAESHAFDIVSSDNFELAGVCSRHPERLRSFATRFGAPGTFTTPDHMLQSGTCEAIVVAVPPHAVLNVTRTVLEHGYLALIEKPIATAPRVLETLISLSETAETPAIVGFNRRYQRHVRAAVETLRSGALGPIRTVRAGWSGPYANRFAAHAPTYRARAGNRNGLLVDTGSHVFDLLTWIFGDFLRVEGCEVKTNERGADFNFTTVLRADHTHIAVAAEDNDGPECRQVAIEGEDGSIALDETGTTITIGRSKRRIPAEDERRPVDDLVALHEDRPALGASLRDAVRVSRLLVEAYDFAGAPKSRPWCRPRFKPWGRLNGSC